MKIGKMILDNLDIKFQNHSLRSTLIRLIIVRVQELILIKHILQIGRLLSNGILHVTLRIYMYLSMFCTLVNKEFFPLPKRQTVRLSLHLVYYVCVYANII
jgi:hypothetical protein